MVNVIWTGDTLAIVWFWQVSNLIYKPYCVSSMPDRKLITFDTPRCSGKRLLFARFYLISLSTVKRQLNKQEGVLSEGLDAGNGERRQMTVGASRWIPAFSWMSNCANRVGLCSIAPPLRPFHFRCCRSLYCPAANMAAEPAVGSNIVQ